MDRQWLLGSAKGVQGVPGADRGCVQWMTGDFKVYRECEQGLTGVAQGMTNKIQGMTGEDRDFHTYRCFHR